MQAHRRAVWTAACWLARLLALPLPWAMRRTPAPHLAACPAPVSLQFLIGGDGPKRALLERIVAEHGLQGRVSLVGAVPHERVRQLLVQGQVFLNCSLTEAFCMALVEAAAAGGLCHADERSRAGWCKCGAVLALHGSAACRCLPHVRFWHLIVKPGALQEDDALAVSQLLALLPCTPHAGLLVVSTRVGGVPEVLPPDMLLLADPSPEGLVDAVGEALERVAWGGRDAWEQHAAVRDMYSWQSIAARTEAVYRAVLRDPQRDDSMAGRLARYYKCGKWFGKICCCVTGGWATSVCMGWHPCFVGGPRLRCAAVQPPGGGACLASAVNCPWSHTPPSVQPWTGCTGGSWSGCSPPAASSQHPTSPARQQRLQQAASGGSSTCARLLSCGRHCNKLPNFLHDFVH